MAAKKFLTLVNGLVTAIAGIQTSAGATDGGKIPALDDTGRLSSTMMPVGLGAETYSATATEALSAGAFVDLYTVGGTLSARNADGSATGKGANGFVLSAVANGALATVYRAGANTAVSDLTTGGDVWLSQSVAGGVTQVAPDESATGKTIQRLGVATSATSIAVSLGDAIAT